MKQEKIDKKQNKRIRLGVILSIIAIIIALLALWNPFRFETKTGSNTEYNYEQLSKKLNKMVPEKVVEYFEENPLDTLTANEIVSDPIFSTEVKEVVKTLNIKGEQGVAGKNGINGTNGKDGLNGTDGADSTVPGPTGPKGDKGDTGEIPDVSSFITQSQLEEALEILGNYVEIANIDNYLSNYLTQTDLSNINNSLSNLADSLNDKANQSDLDDLSNDVYGQSGVLIVNNSTLTSLACATNQTIIVGSTTYECANVVTGGTLSLEDNLADVRRDNEANGGSGVPRNTLLTLNLTGKNGDTIATTTVDLSTFALVSDLNDALDNAVLEFVSYTDLLPTGKIYVEQRSTKSRQDGSIVQPFHSLECAINYADDADIASCMGDSNIADRTGLGPIPHASIIIGKGNDFSNESFFGENSANRLFTSDSVNGTADTLFGYLEMTGEMDGIGFESLNFTNTVNINTTAKKSDVNSSDNTIAFTNSVFTGNILINQEDSPDNSMMYVDFIDNNYYGNIDINGTGAVYVILSNARFHHDTDYCEALDNSSPNYTGNANDCASSVITINNPNAIVVIKGSNDVSINLKQGVLYVEGDTYLSCDAKLDGLGDTCAPFILNESAPVGTMIHFQNASTVDYAEKLHPIKLLSDQAQFYLGSLAFKRVGSDLHGQFVSSGIGSLQIRDMETRVGYTSIGSTGEQFTIDPSESAGLLKSHLNGISNSLILNSKIDSSDKVLSYTCNQSDYYYVIDDSNISGIECGWKANVDLTYEDGVLNLLGADANTPIKSIDIKSQLGLETMVGVKRVGSMTINGVIYRNGQTYNMNDLVDYNYRGYRATHDGVTSIPTVPSSDWIYDTKPYTIGDTYAGYVDFVSVNGNAYYTTTTTTLSQEVIDNLEQDIIPDGWARLTGWPDKGRYLVVFMDDGSTSWIKADDLFQLSGSESIDITNNTVSVKTKSGGVITTAGGLDVRTATDTELGVVKGSNGDLQAYINSDGTITINNLSTKLSAKVNVVEGKGLSENDYTDADKSALASLSGILKITGVDSPLTFNSTTGKLSLEVIPVTLGGTGQTSLTSGYVLEGNGISAVKFRGITDITSGSLTANTNLITANTLNYLLGKKQDILVSGTNIKTINGSSVLGSGNISIANTLSIHQSLVFSFSNSANTIAAVNESVRTQFCPLPTDGTLLSGVTISITNISGASNTIPKSFKIVGDIASSGDEEEGVTISGTGFMLFNDDTVKNTVTQATFYPDTGDIRILYYTVTDTLKGITIPGTNTINGKQFIRTKLTIE